MAGVAKPSVYDSINFVYYTDELKFCPLLIVWNRSVEVIQELPSTIHGGGPSCSRVKMFPSII
jgi:hypothetical protein